jgi:ribosomal protein S18 acetylase RimI-like enzyme
MAVLVWRNLQADDVNAYAELDKACTVVDGEVVVPWSSFERITSTPTIFTVGGFATDAGGQLIAAGYSEKSGEQVIFKTKVHPAYRPENFEKSILETLQKHARMTYPEITEHIIRNEELDEISEQTYSELGYQTDFIELRMHYPVGQALPEMNTNATFETWTDENQTDFFTTYLDSFRERLTDQPAPDAEEWMADHSEDEDFRPDWSFLAWVDGQPVGFVTMFHWVDSYPHAYLSQIGTVPGVRGQGISVTLISKVLALVEAAQIPYLDLHVNTNNAQAIRVYERVGFQMIGRRGKFSRVIGV